MKLKNKNNSSFFFYPESFCVQTPRPISQLLSEAFNLFAAVLLVTRPHFTLQPAGGGKVPQQPGGIVVCLTLANSHGHILPHCSLGEI